jgi:hypothetical protein
MEETLQIQGTIMRSSCPVLVHPQESAAPGTEESSGFRVLRLASGVAQRSVYKNDAHGLD